MKTRLLLMVALVAALSFSLAGSPARASLDNAFIRIVNASPDAPAVDFYLDGSKTSIAGGLGFGDHTDFIEIPSGQHSYAIRPAGGTATDKPLLQSKFTANPGTSANLVVIGFVQGKPVLRLGIYFSTRTPTDGKARVEIIHVAPDAPVQVDLMSKGKIISPAVGFDPDTVRHVDLAPDSYDLAITPTGNNTKVLIDLPSTKLEADTIYTIFAIGKIQSIRALTLTSKNGTSFVRVIHAAPDAPAVDIYLDKADKPAFSGIQFGAHSDFVELPSKSYAVSIRAAGAAATDKPLLTSEITVLPGMAVDVVALGLLKGTGNQKLALVGFRTDLTPANGKARLEVIHAIPDAPAIDVVAAGKALMTNVGFSQDGPVQDLTPNSYDIAIYRSGTRKDPFLTLAGTQLDADKLYTVVASNVLSKVSPLVISIDLPKGAAPAAPAPTMAATPGK